MFECESGCGSLVDRDGDSCAGCREKMAATFAEQIRENGGIEKHGHGICPSDCPICLEDE